MPSDKLGLLTRFRTTRHRTNRISTTANPMQAMAKNLQLQALRNGFKQPTGTDAREVLMATHKHEDEKMAITSGSEVLWTQFMSDCRSVATYTPSTGWRSLTHLQGGNASDVFYMKLVQSLKPDSRIIFIAGGSDMDEEDFTTRIFKNFREEMDEMLLAAGMTSQPPPANYEAYWSDAVPSRSKGFVFKPDGRYGILNPNGEPG